MSYFTEEQELWLVSNGWQKHESGWWDKTANSECHNVITPKIISDRTWYLYDYDCPDIKAPDEVDYNTKTFTSADALFRYIEKERTKP